MYSISLPTLLSKLSTNAALCRLLVLTSFEHLPRLWFSPLEFCVEGDIFIKEKRVTLDID